MRYSTGSSLGIVAGLGVLLATWLPPPQTRGNGDKRRCPLRTKVASVGFETTTTGHTPRHTGMPSAGGGELQLCAYTGSGAADGQLTA